MEKTVEQLIKELEKFPKHYKVHIHQHGSPTVALPTTVIIEKYNRMKHNQIVTIKAQ